MARGFDSKSVSDQQEELERSRERRQQGEPQKAVVSARRRQLELARVDVVRRMETSTVRYRESLEAALAALDAQLAQQPESPD